MGFLFAALAVLLATSSSVRGDGLNVRAKQNGLHYFGTEVSTAVLNDAAANAIAIRNEDFGTYTCEYEMKFAYTEPSRNTFSYDLADRIVNQALSNGMIMRCHNLVWYQSLPTWITNGNFDNATLISIMVNHITNVVTHFKGKCYAWDVVNEAIYADGTFRGQTSASQSLWYKTIGPAYIPIAFAAAAAADPSAKLYYNDYSIETPSTKTTAAINLVKMVKAYGARIDGVGLQAHFSAGAPTQAHLISSLQSFAALGVEVAYTELDVSTPSSAPNYAQQATDYATVVGACQQVPQCVGITVWGFTDKYTWIVGSYPDLWNTTLGKKPAYYSTLAQLGPDPEVDDCGCASF
ncbi:Endo-1,4-beta-xylanase 1 [Cytospora mali]|uniref:Beta-xylanase n=1 Tax=Cytospora mali TaxID=578113 RepID=A0A194VH49_CYTMA|nr:Endo-1,4-beta-xylanase 1 [Valsa mali]QZJ84313.1 Xyl4 [Valsa mali]